MNIHHYDSYAVTLVPFMIGMGVDIWQGATKSNDLLALIQKYGGQISVMAGIDQTAVDEPNWRKENITKQVRWACKNYEKMILFPVERRELTLVSMMAYMMRSVKK